MTASDKTMFEIYRETDYNRGYRCIFYTELGEHARDKEIARAAAGESLFSGFVPDDRREEARRLVDELLAELNEQAEDARPPSTDQIGRRLASVLVT